MIIAVWGNGYSGKSTLAIKLALLLSETKKNVLLIDTDYVTPQLGIWYPSIQVNPNNSLSNILQNDINTEILLSKIKAINNNLGVIGYAKGELSAKNAMQREDTPYSLLDVAQSFADYVIVDCNTNMLQDILSFAAISKADKRIISCTPDAYAVSWYLSNVPMLQDAKYNIQNAIRVFNKIKDISPTSTVEKVLGTFNYYFPYCSYLEWEMYDGSQGGLSGAAHSKPYMNVLKSLMQEVVI